MSSALRRSGTTVGRSAAGMPRRGWFVYRGEARHVWRFVHFSRNALDADAAVASAVAEAREMGDESAGEFLVVPASHAFTRTV